MRPNILKMAGYVPGEQPRDGEYLKLNTNENPYPPSPRVFEAIQKNLTSDRLRKYPEPLGDSFREAAAPILGVAPEQILIGNGSDDILTIVTRAIVPEGGVLASLTPSYILYKSLAEIQGAHFLTVPFTADWKIPSPWPLQAHLVCVPNPNSPSGTFFDPTEVLRLAQESGGYVVLDEAYADFAPTNGLHLAQGKIIVSRTLSKSYSLAGIRFGFAVADRELVPQFIKVKDSYNCDVLSLAAATAAIRDQAYLAEIKAKLIRTRERLYNALLELGLSAIPSQANFVWCRSSGLPNQVIYQKLKERKILVRYMNYPDFGDGLRITVGTDSEIDSLLKALREILS
ncbi:MAG: histidinol-phosphate transaminase [Gemmataceae bacterium]|jgi:histidinol-phosphate aminotransferase|nr:histidinol-phosphate transaminase [Gemmataceae bacterium]